MMVTSKVRLVRQLGEGGMGSVWVAEHLELRTQVAVKFITASALASNPSLLERFKREAKASAAIRSPHVISIFDTGATSEGIPYIVMELLDGESLGDRLRRVGRLSLGEVCEVLGCVCPLTFNQAAN